MKKIKAFSVALAVFMTFAITVHFLSIAVLPKQNRDFGYWISYSKDASYEALKRNITPETALYMGSSEFHHGLSHKYNPANLFRGTDLNLMCIGGAFNQSLNHAIAVGALGSELQNKKVALILSPTWFYKNDRQRETKFILRFSEGEYKALMENRELSEETKAKVKLKVETLLGKVDTATGGIGMSGIDDLLRRERDRNKCATSWLMTKKTAVNDTWNSENIDFQTLKEEAEKECRGKCTNECNMQDKVFEKNFASKLTDRKNCNSKKSFEGSEEYDDLQLFLDICREQGLEVLLIMQPLNGKWYDYTGLTSEKRNVVYETVGEIAKQKGVEYADLSGEEYTENFFEDAVHPTSKGWVIINEKAYEFFKKNQQ